LTSIYQLFIQFFKNLFFNHNDINKVEIYEKIEIKICTTNVTNYNVYRICSLFKRPILIKEISECNSIQNMENEGVLKLWHKHVFQ